MTMVWVLVSLLVLIAALVGFVGRRDRARTSSREDTEAGRAALAAARLGAAKGYSAQSPGDTARRINDGSPGTF